GLSGALATDLTVSRTVDNSSCRITGTPTITTTGAVTVTVTATNAGGMSSATVSVTVNPPAPPLPSAPVLTADDAAVTLTQGQAIAPITFTNSGGAPNSDSATPRGCTISGLSGALATDLTASRTANGLSCRITGTPTIATSGAVTVTVTATNAGGADTATVDITVNAASTPLFVSPNPGQVDTDIAGFEFCCGKINTYTDHGFAATGDFIQLDGGFWASGITGSVGMRAFSSYGDGSPDETTDVAHLGPTATGTLTSPSFTIGTNYINFLVGGGRSAYNAAHATAVVLIVGGNVVRATSGDNVENTLRAASWDVREFDGMTATVQFIDRHENTGGTGHLPYLIADEFRGASVASAMAQTTLPSSPLNDKPLFVSAVSGQENLYVAGFEFCCGKVDTYTEHGFSAATGDFNQLDGGFYAVGDITGAVGERVFSSYGDGSPDESTDPAQLGLTATGTLTSPSFTIDTNYINFLVGGGNALYGSTRQTAVVLVVDIPAAGNTVTPTVVRAASGDNTANTLRAVSWDVSEYAGMNAAIQIIDDHDNTAFASFLAYTLADEFRAADEATATPDTVAPILALEFEVVAGRQAFSLTPNEAGIIYFVRRDAALSNPSIADIQTIQFGGRFIASTPGLGRFIIDLCYAAGTTYYAYAAMTDFNGNDSEVVSATFVTPNDQAPCPSSLLPSSTFASPPQQASNQDAFTTSAAGDAAYTTMSPASGALAAELGGAPAPVVSAGADQTVAYTDGIVVLDASASFASAGASAISQYAWTQTSGVRVGLYGADTALASFDPAAAGINGDELRFTVTATDSLGASATDEVVINVYPALPELLSPAQTYVVRAGEPITAIVLRNTGGGHLLETNGCTAPNLATGLTLSRTPDGHSCQITGTLPSALASLINLSIEASNATGTTTNPATISIQAQ
ncbi:MAG: putative Ig domain-containing protein, partial [Gammaproteobacteria bacterium]|nr:putative Ig domain-containing protein [Gammaproteobacteria bacterium]